MGTETANLADVVRSAKGNVKLNNPQMGTETLLILIEY